MRVRNKVIKDRRFKTGKIMLLCMIAMLLVSVMSINSHASAIDFGSKVAELQKKFPHGKYWNHVGLSADNSDGYTETACSLHKTSGVDHVYGTNGCTCNHFAGGGHLSATQCMGFANKLGYDVFGNTTWTKISNPTSVQIADIRVGDIVRLGYDSHSVFVIARTGNNIMVGEANYPKDCQISWGRIIELSTANITYYERAANYDSVISGTGTTETTESPSTEEPTTEQPTTETPVTEISSTFTGWQKAADGENYQYVKAGKILKSKWITLNKKKYYVDKNGYRVTGLKKIGSNRYYFNSKGVLQKKKWITFEGGTYYIGSGGYALLSQWLYYGNTLVYVTSDGSIAKNEMVKISGRTYYFNSAGKRSKGFKKYKGKYYYCDSKGVIRKKKWITLGTKKYYLQKNGARAQSVLLKIGKYRYYFNEKGYMVKNKKVTYKGKIYKADKNGHCTFLEEEVTSEETSEPEDAV